MLRDFAEVGALSGMRLEEIGSLKRQHVDLKAMTVDFPSIKTEAAQRKVPLHSHLKDIFTRRVEAAKEPQSWLFPECPERDPKSLLECTSLVSKAFTRYRRSVGVDDPMPHNPKRSRVDFHSFRRWSINKAEQNGAHPWIISAIAGHTREGMSLGTYSAGPELETQMRPIVEAVKLSDTQP